MVGQPAAARADQELLLGRHRPSLSEVRRWARAQLAAEPDAVVADILLVVNELVSNAYRYTAGPSLLCIGRVRGRVRVEVVHDARTRVARASTGPRQGGGLMLVARLADRWGVERRHGGTTVWADIPLG